MHRDREQLDAIAVGIADGLQGATLLELVAELPHTPTGRVAKHELLSGLTGNEIDAESTDRRSSSEAMTRDEPWLRTSLGSSDADSITDQGRDLASELMGKVSFTELAFLVVRGRLPSAGETTMLDAVLVSLADHGLTPTVIAARMTHTGAPESLQGAVAAGLLGAGDVFLGVVESTARLITSILDGAGEAGDDDALRAAAGAAVGSLLESGRRVPGARLRARRANRRPRRPPRRGDGAADRARALRLRGTAGDVRAARVGALDRRQPCAPPTALRYACAGG